ncbi:aminotransferase class V-fold PLP-dependent enzyme, partial [candidate division WOR-3 bacterium]|nr:aminotransferase class V-fold PLP-dependent enzyme [candidate division WOR-3 bacterium]
MGKIYFDNSSSTRMDERVLAEMEPYLFNTYATPTSDFGYSMGTDAKDALRISRETIAKSINALTKEIVFTSGFTESNNLAIKGILKKLKNKKHIIISTIEDFSILNTAKALEKEGYEVTYIGVDEYGLLNIDELKGALRDDTAIVSIQTANQEIGTLQNIKEIAEIVKKKNILL